MPRALVFAADSFLGRHCITALRSAGYVTIGTSRRGDQNLACDITDRQAVEQVVASSAPDVVLQCAAATNTRDLHAMVAVHCLGTTNVLDAVRRHAPTAHLILVGTAAEYGPVPAERLPVDESHVSAPNSLLGATKLAQTALGRAAAAEWRLAVTVVRPFNMVGPGLPAYYAPAALAMRLRDAVVEPKRLEVQNGSATRDFVDVRDVASAIVLLAAAPRDPGACEIYNVATGIETSIIDLARCLCGLGGGCQAIDAGYADSRTQIARSAGDAEKLRRAVGWEPRVDWRQSISDMWTAAAGTPLTDTQLRP